VATIETNGRQRKKLQLGRIRYEVTVTPAGEDGMRRATWFCGECKENGTWSPLGADASELIEQAEIGVHVHHSLYHAGDWKPRKPR
jgi:hypothetical protein